MVSFTLSLARAGAAALLVQSATASFAARSDPTPTCDCTPENQVVRYIVVEMPPKNATAVEAVAAVESSESSPSTTSSAAPVASSASATSTASNSTCTYGPVSAPSIDTSNPANIIPTSNVSLYYGSSGPANSTAGTDNGSINMTLAMGSGAVVLENIASVSTVDCSDAGVSVSFSDAAAFQTAFDAWSAEGSFVMITNHLGDCDAEFERGFFKVESVASNTTNTIFCGASKQDIPSVAQSCEFTFSSLPAASLKKRLTLDPSVSLTFGESLPETVIYSLPPYINVTADEAAFTSTVTFSGYLYYNFWGFKLEKLYFDLDASFSADLALSAKVAAAYSNSFTYAPDALTYSLVSVPGLLSIGPGVAFDIGLDLATDAAVGVTTSFGLAIPDGNVHIDLLNSANNAATGWTPTYSSVINITEKATVEADVSAGLTVELAIKVLGGLIDLSSGLTATPQFNNAFTLASLQEVNGTVASLPSDNDPNTCDQGVYVVSDFLFNLTGFATQWFSANLYSVEVPIVSECYNF